MQTVSTRNNTDPCCIVMSQNRTLSVARYSFIQLSELMQRRVKKIGKASKWQQEDSNLASLDRGSDVLTTVPPAPLFDSLFEPNQTIGVSCECAAYSK